MQESLTLKLKFRMNENESSFTPLPPKTSTLDFLHRWWGKLALPLTLPLEAA